MEFCTTHGIPHSKFLSWSEEDQDKSTAFMLHQKANCPYCGTNPADWLDEDGKPVEPAPYEPVVHLCLGCETLEERKKEIPKGKEGNYHAHLRPRIEKRVNELNNAQSSDDGGPGGDRQGIR